MIRTIGFALAALLPLAVLAQTPLLLRLEMRAVDSVTLSAEQFLAGDQTSGKKVTLAGELRIPGAPRTKVPAVILVHGSGGISGATDTWVRELNAMGIAAFIPELHAQGGQQWRHPQRQDRQALRPLRCVRRKRAACRLQCGRPPGDTCRRA